MIVSMTETDPSHGYEQAADEFIKTRNLTIGISCLDYWPARATILDLGCGTGFPVTDTLIRKGLLVYGIDASPTLVRYFRHHFPGVPIACEAVEESTFFNRSFDGVIACGLLFLLPAEVQKDVLRKSARALKTGGKLLFTAPSAVATWTDRLTQQECVSLGAEPYKSLLAELGMNLIEEFEDEGNNHYYHAIKI